MAKLLFSLAAIILLHSAFSAYEHLSELKALERSQDLPLPLDIVLETLAALLLGIFGAVINTPPLKEITWSSEMKHRTADEMDARLSFATVNHKGRNIFGS